ncbi:alpha-galactosidase [Streptomyces sp. NEAU-S7GS2]|uniref:alpha-galactosidase n=1 Tax=Streptomyces sp. NEAU-S7GS2 TaxID=2202000 RepID=UPI000D6FD8A6|nr:alpha-galactosidase [Streptomyces sp. NEAU-S7GS2]AWN30976.1 alpha-galactosidase [Streptomyces sp. NEAU-S7GS2]
MDDLLHFRAAGTSLVLDLSGTGLPRIVHWGADLGASAPGRLAGLRAADVPQTVPNALDEPVPLSVLPQQSAGWLGTPGVSGHRAGRAAAPAFTVHGTSVRDESRSLTVEAVDPEGGLALTLELGLTGAGLVRLRAAVTNTGEGPYHLTELTPALPVPAQATELLDLTGRHLRERAPQRHAFTLGTHLRESRRGRTGSDATLLLTAGEAGFGFRAGEVWGLHVAWSGNHRSLAERTPAGHAVLAGGELLLPGEIRLAPGATYRSPWLYGSYGRNGLDELAGRFHRELRARDGHPASPRPVTLNTWEAVYFDQDLATLERLARTAAEAGAERFVLDDGWFRGRRDDHAGLGDWYVDAEVWPDGLRPLIDTVRGLGMQFGLWVEPEMINPDSDLARAHPEWVLAASPSRLPPASRHQQVLDLARPEAYAYVLARLDTLLREHRIDYLKWDHNRDLVDAAAHHQTTAAYRLLDELRSRHPQLEIESCASGGARVDLGVLERTDRVWTSDCIDALERQRIQRWTGLLLPPELLGAHVGAPVAHTTGRRHTLDFRAGTALFCHFGIEWDLTAASAAERARLAEWVALHRTLRPLLHSGTVVHGDHPDPALWVHGVVAGDAGRAVFALVQMATSVQSPAGRVRLPGLDPDADYRLAPLAPGDRPEGPATSTLPWWEQGVTLPGRVLAEVGVQAPTLFPERLVLLEAVRL